MDEITSIEDIDLNQDAEAELRSLLAEEFAAALDDFRERIEGTGLEGRFRDDLGIEIYRRIDKIVATLDHLADQRRYRLYDFPAEREMILDEFLHGDPMTFVDREEVPDTPTQDRYFVIGPSGSGKSRIIAERVRRLPDNAVAHVLIPDELMLDPSDAKALARESFNGDLLLVWEDVHRIDEARENVVLERTLRELDSALDDAGHELYTLLEARSGHLDDVPGTLPADFENPKSLWSPYEPLRVGNLDERSIREIADAMAAEFDIERLY